MTHLANQSYGKSNVRLSRISRNGGQHDFVEISADITLRGDFDTAYTEGDNRNVIPTDTMKNTVFALAKTAGIASIEQFSVTLARHFLQRFGHVDEAEVCIREHCWNRLIANGGQHPHAFAGGQNEHRTCCALTTRHQTTLKSGLVGLQVLKTTESGFSGFHRDEYTTLAETEDRIFATTISTDWPCRNLEDDWSAHRRSIRAALLDVFANRFSPSVQKTIFEMADAAFAACPAIDEISITMPNQHHILANLETFGLENNNEVFVPTAEPFGMISATIQRTGSES